jgi:hypothetical protein
MSCTCAPGQHNVFATVTETFLTVEVPNTMAGEGNGEIRPFLPLTQFVESFTGQRKAG